MDKGEKPDDLFCAGMGPIVNLEHVPGRKLGIALRSGKALVTQQFLNGSQVRTLFQHVGAKRMTQSMRVHIRGETLGDGNFLDDASNAAGGQAASAPVDEKRSCTL